DIRSMGVRCACRGSAAGSLVCYLTRISDVDPVRHGLLFERFINPHRDELPDIDIDVESARRADVYGAILARHGADRWAGVHILGVRMLSAMRHCLDEIARTEDTKVDLDEIPLRDPATFDLIRRSDTLGCFQIESPGQRELLQKFQPTEWSDLIIDISLFRPGPVKSDMITPFLNRRHGVEPEGYPHPLLKPALEESHGVVVYHEQVMIVL